ncbi:hypothetical protein ACIBG6_32695 [Streptomyces sp. NPDC050842]
METTQVKQAQRFTAEHRVLLEQIAGQAPLHEVWAEWPARERR